MPKRASKVRSHTLSIACKKTGFGLLAFVLILSGTNATSMSKAAAADLTAASCPTVQVTTTSSVTMQRNASTCVLEFKSGSNTFVPPAGVQSVSLLIVGGGGAGGGGSWAGGGGAGSVLYSASYSVTAGTTYNIAVGAGGAGTTGGRSNGGSGGASTFGSVTASGGGGGAGYGWADAGVTGDGVAGGSGGGTSEEDSKIAQGGAFVQADYSGFTKYGNRGGNQGNQSGSQAGSGGGGAGGAGGDVPASSASTNRQPEYNLELENNLLLPAAVVVHLRQ